MAEQIIQIKSAPGIKRDGTRLEGDNYVDDQWSPEGGEPIHFKTLFEDEATLTDRLLSLQTLYASLRD